MVDLNTQAKTAKVTTPILQHSPPNKKFLKNWLLALPGGALTTYPNKLRQKFFLAQGARAPRAPPGYAYVPSGEVLMINSISGRSRREKVSLSIRV